MVAGPARPDWWAARESIRASARPDGICAHFALISTARPSPIVLLSTAQDLSTLYRCKSMRFTRHDIVLEICVAENRVMNVECERSVGWGTRRMVCPTC